MSTNLKLEDGSPIRLAMFRAFENLLPGAPATEEGLVTRFDRLQALWKPQAKQLVKSGWYPKKTGYFLENCPTIGGNIVEQRACQRYYVCPFCWSRQIVTECYKRLMFVWFGYSGNRWKDLPMLKKKHRGYLFQLKGYTYVPIEKSLPSLMSELVKSQQEFQRKFASAAGSFVLTTIDRVRQDWRIIRRMLAILPAGYNYSNGLPDTSPDFIVMPHYGRLNPYQLAEIVADVCQYPEYLLQVPAEEILPILKARSGERGKQPRMMAYHGLLRNKASRKRLSSMGYRGDS